MHDPAGDRGAVRQRAGVAAADLGAADRLHPLPRLEGRRHHPGAEDRAPGRAVRCADRLAGEGPARRQQHHMRRAADGMGNNYRALHRATERAAELVDALEGLE